MEYLFVYSIVNRIIIRRVLISICNGSILKTTDWPCDETDCSSQLVIPFEGQKGMNTTCIYRSELIVNYPEVSPDDITIYSDNSNSITGNSLLCFTTNNYKRTKHIPIISLTLDYYSFQPI